ncbi:redox-regulated ATPase YchF [Patescibacteria group bacterium]
MSLKIGIVGLPNVGKSTLFNALTKSSQAEASNYPFCTIDPNVGIITVPDKRLEKLGKLVKPEKVTPTAIEFVDIAGLVKDAHKGEGLGNQFLSHIKEVDLILQVVRFFEDDDIQHTDKTIDPLRDLEIINLELILADLSTIKNTLEKIEPKVRAGEKELTEKFDILKKIQKELEDGKMLNQLKLDNDGKELIKEFNFLTAKPFLYIANLSEDQLPKDGKLIKNGIDFIPISAKIEAEVNSLDGKEQKEYLESIGLKESGLNQVIKKSYQALGLITFFTAGPTEARAWTVKKGTLAPQAAGVIHTDFEKGFIKAEVTSYNDYIQAGSELKAKEAGKMRIEGKEYVVQDGDVILFKV